MRIADGNDSLGWIDGDGKSVTQSQLAILKAAECAAGTPAVPRQENHHKLVEAGVRHMLQEKRKALADSSADRPGHASASMSA